MYNDRKAPRFNPRLYRYNVISKELWKAWKKETGYKLTFSQFKNIWNAIGETITDSVSTSRDGVRLGGGLGDIYAAYVQGRNVENKQKPLDFKLSLEYDKEIRHQNWENSGKVGKIIYGTYKRPYIYKYATWYGFTGHRRFKNKMSKAFRETPSLFKNSIEKRTLI